MKNQIVSNYGRVLYELEISEESIRESYLILQGTPQLTEALNNPVVSRKEKCRIIDRIFPADICNFLKMACDHREIGRILDIFQAYELYAEGKKGIVRAYLTYVTAPDERQQEGIQSFVKREFGAKEVKLLGVRDDALIGGFILRVGSQEYDWSTKGKLQRLERELTSADSYAKA
ncbi:MAG: ATP synthase F1 subunit delta [Hespellia sp.]|nr:ATP synthase F1 subunit delta [Hespellia sp.]